MRKRTSPLIAAAAAATLALVGCSGSTPENAANGELIPVRLALSAPPSLESVISDCVPRVAGFFEDEGLDVKVETTEGAILALQALETGNADVIATGSQALMSAIAAGSTAKAFSTVVTGSYAYPAVLPDSPIKTILDLEGTSIGVPSLQSGSIPFIRGLMALEGGDASTIEFLPVGFGAEGLAALRNGDVDALGLWDTAYAVIEGLGEKLRYIESDESEQLGFQVVYVAKSEYLDDHPDVALGLSRAMNKAYVYASENPKAALHACWDVYPSLIPTGVDPADAEAAGLAAITARLASSGPVDGLYGNSSTDQIQTFYSLQVAAGTIKPGITIDQLWTDEFIADANDFDEEPIKKLADEWTE